jgi:hypothetical protein
MHEPCNLNVRIFNCINSAFQILSYNKSWLEKEVPKFVCRQHDKCTFLVTNNARLTCRNHSLLSELPRTNRFVCSSTVNSHLIPTNKTTGGEPIQLLQAPKSRTVTGNTLSHSQRKMAAETIQITTETRSIISEGLHEQC